MKSSFITACLLFCTALLFGQTKSNLELTDIFHMEYISDPQISPDGKQILYVRNFKDIMTDKNLSNIWIANADGTRNRPITTGNQNDFQPRWSHDGKKFIFKSNRQDSKMKLYLCWMDTKDIVPLTNTPQAPSQVSWSPDDRQIAFNMFVPKSTPSAIKMPKKPDGAKWNTPPIYIDKMNYRGDGRGYLKGGYMQLFTLPIDGGTPRQLTSKNANHGAPQWSKDGSSLYFSANFNEEADMKPLNSDIYRLSLADGKIQPLTDRFGPDNAPSVSPNGKKIVYLGFDDELLGYQISRLYVMDHTGENKTLISKNFDRKIDKIAWASSGKGLYIQYVDHGHTKVAHMSLDGTVQDMIDNVGGLSFGRPYNSGSFSVSHTDAIAYTQGGSEHLADLAIYDRNKKHQLTNVNDDLFSFKNIGKVTELNWVSSYDQQEIQGWMVTPPNFDPSKKYPFILEIHGGPFASYGAEFSSEIQAYAAAGYVVLYCNPRGSSGYGSKFGNLIHHNYPNQDYDDLMSGVDAVIKKGFIDEDQLYVTGGSGGGVLTAWILGKTDRFRAAVVAKPVINWASFVLYADSPAFFSKYWFGKKPWEDPDSYFKRSPLSYVANVKTPTMLLTGEEDYRTPIAESEQFYSALKLEGVETAMVRIPGASHGIARRPSNLIAKIASILTWFDKHKD